jgi:hypothetical protein
MLYLLLYKFSFFRTQPLQGNERISNRGMFIVCLKLKINAPFLIALDLIRQVLSDFSNIPKLPP